MSVKVPVRPFVLGLLLTDEWAASPNMGETTGDGASKAARMKAIKTSEGMKTIISGQSIGSWHRQALYERFGWVPSELQETISGRDTRSFYTQCQPIQYPEDDGRGYLAAVTIEEKPARRGKEKDVDLDESTVEAKAKAEKKKLPLTTKRTSPFMLSQFQSVAPNARMNDFGILARGLDYLPEEAKGSMIFRAEIAAAAYAGLFALNISELGRFAVGIGRDLLPFAALKPLLTPARLSAYKKSEVQRTKEEVDSVDALIKALKRGVNADRGQILVLPGEVRQKRAHDLLAALADLEGGAHMTRRLYNVAPSTALVAFMNGGNCLPPHLIRAIVRDEEGSGSKTYKFVVDVERLEKVISDNKDRFIPNKEGYSLFFGTLGTPSIENAPEVKAFFEREIHGIKCKFCDGPRSAIREAASTLPLEWFARPEGAQLIDDSLLFGEALLKAQI